MSTPHRIRITAPQKRPDFRQVIAFLWREDHNVDSDGNSHNPASRDWTELYLASRETADPPVSVSPEQQSPLVLSVESSSSSLAAKLAYYLATSTGGAVALEASDTFSSPEVLLPVIGDFDVSAALFRAASSRYSRSTLEQPHPTI